MNPIRVLEVRMKISRGWAIVRFLGICLVAVVFFAGVGFFVREFPREEAKFQEIGLVQVPNADLVPTSENLYQSGVTLSLSKGGFHALAPLADDGKISVYSRYGISYFFTIKGAPFSYWQEFSVPRWYEVQGASQIDGQVASRYVYRSWFLIVGVWAIFTLLSLGAYIALASTFRTGPTLYFPWAFFMRPPSTCT